MIIKHGYISTELPIEKESFHKLPDFSLNFVFYSMINNTATSLQECWLYEKFCALQPQVTVNQLNGFSTI